MTNRKKTDKKIIWSKPTISVLKIRDTLSKDYSLFTEERNEADPFQAPGAGKFDNDGPS